MYYFKPTNYYSCAIHGANIIVLVSEINDTAKKSSWLAGHLQRCIKLEDKIRLTMMIAVNALKLSILLDDLSSSARSIHDELLPKRQRVLPETRPSRLLN